MSAVRLGATTMNVHANIVQRDMPPAAAEAVAARAGGEAAAAADGDDAAAGGTAGDGDAVSQVRDMVALDCEMCYCGEVLEVTRITLLDADGKVGFWRGFKA